MQLFSSVVVISISVCRNAAFLGRTNVDCASLCSRWSGALLGMYRRAFLWTVDRGVRRRRRAGRGAVRAQVKMGAKETKTGVETKTRMTMKGDEFEFTYAQGEGKKGGESPSYEEWTVDELTDRAKELGIEGYSKMKKDELIGTLREH